MGFLHLADVHLDSVFAGRTQRLARRLRHVARTVKGHGGRILSLAGPERSQREGTQG